jgi:hypothetical protein
MPEDILLSGKRPDAHDGLKIQYFPRDGHIQILILAQNNPKPYVFELAGIEDLRELSFVIQRALDRHQEITDPGADCLSNIRRMLSPQVQDVENALLNVK